MAVDEATDLRKHLDRQHATGVLMLCFVLCFLVFQYLQKGELPHEIQKMVTDERAIWMLLYAFGGMAVMAFIGWRAKQFNKASAAHNHKD